MILFFKHGTKIIPIGWELGLVEYDQVTPADGDETVTEAIRLVIPACPEVTNLREDLEALFHAARLFELSQIGDKAEIYFSPWDNNADLYSCIIKNGHIQFDNDRDVIWIGKRVTQANLIIQREAFWEGPEVEVPLATSAQSRRTGGVNIQNAQDSWFTNTIRIEGQDVDGEKPADVRIEFQNNYGTTIGSVWVSHNVNSDPTSFNHVLEAETATHSGSNQGPITDNFSGRYYVKTSIGESENSLLKWTISNTLLNQAKGNAFHAMGIFPNTTTYDEQALFKWQIRGISSPYSIWESDYFMMDHRTAFRVRDMGIIRLPPWGQVVNAEQLELHLRARTLNGATINDVDIDCFHLFPVDGYMLMREAIGIASGEKMIYDGLANDHYSTKTGVTYRRGSLNVRGKIQLIPNRDQRLYFLSHSVVMYNMYPYYASIVRMYYRPKRSWL
jgi:hypothetical protein